jgi:hypothetical protein
MYQYPSKQGKPNEVCGIDDNERSSQKITKYILRAKGGIDLLGRHVSSSAVHVFRCLYLLVSTDSLVLTRLRQSTSPVVVRQRWSSPLAADSPREFQQRWQLVVEDRKSHASNIVSSLGLCDSLASCTVPLFRTRIRPSHFSFCTENGSETKPKLVRRRVLNELTTNSAVQVRKISPIFLQVNCEFSAFYSWKFS